MEIGIIGLPKSGKTTVFNALTGGKAETAAYATALAPNLGVVKVPDPRLEVLQSKFQPRRVVPAEVKYVDIAASPKGLGKGEGVGGQYLSLLSNVDALLHVVRAFRDDSIPHVAGSLEPRRDIDTMNLELAFSDLGIIEKRLQRLEVSLKMSKPSERTEFLREQSLLLRIKSALEKDIPLREQSLTEEEKKILANYQFLTAKPLLIGLNIGEEDLPRASSLETELRSQYSRPQTEVAAICAKLEMELGQLSDAEAVEFAQAMGLKERGRERIIRLSYKLLGLISFFTTASAELKAWTIPQGTSAIKAAGKIHSDMERGFIRAEVISYNDLVKSGSVAEGRKLGLWRLEGKNYIIKDGDIVTFLFNV